MLRYSKIIFLAGFLYKATIFSAGGQQMTFPDFSSRLSKYCEAVPWEEIYVHSDRSDYVAGEEMWLSIYAIDRTDGKLSGRSRIVYLELLNQWNVPVIQKRFLLHNGRAQGNSWLPDSLSSGTYTLRAYTNWMKNFLPENCYMTSIDIYNPFKTRSFLSKFIAKEAVNYPFNISFFPEGGTLLTGTKAKIVARVVDNYGRGITFSGIVRNESGDSTAAFETDKYGFGSFEITPRGDEDYFVNSAGRKISLPGTNDEGFSLHADLSESGSMEVIYSARGAKTLSSKGSYSLLVINKGIIGYVTSLKPGNTSSRITIPASLITQGINHLLIMENYSRVVCERLFYKPVNNSMDAALSLPAEAGRREKVELELKIAAADSTRLKLTGLSISVFPASYSDHFRQIDDFMVFGSEFGILPWSNSRGGLNDADQNTIDNFLISAKSLWLDWERILDKEDYNPVYRFETEGHFLSGYLKMREPSKGDTAKLLFMNIAGKVADFRYARTDKTGRFDFLLPADNYQRKLIIQPEQMDENLVLSLDQPFSWKLPASHCFVDTSSQALAARFSALSFNYQTGRIYSTPLRNAQDKIRPAPPALGRFYGIPELEIRMDDYIQLPVMNEVFFELAPGVRFRERRDEYEMRIINPFSNFFYDDPPMVMIDGVYMPDLSYIANLDPELVERIDITRTPYLIGDLTIHGIVNVVTRKGNMANISLPDHVVEMSYRVVDDPATIILPDYSDIRRMKSRTPDLRNTIYWNPSFIPDSTGKSKLEFWTSDILGEYIIDIQGITWNGDRISLKRTLSVR